jgi:hypothetical protein
MHRRYLVQLIQEWTGLKECAADRDMEFALVVEAELFRLDSVIRWLDSADGRIKRAALEPAATNGVALPKLPRKAGCGDDRVGVAPGFEDLWGRTDRGAGTARRLSFS